MQASPGSWGPEARGWRGLAVAVTAGVGIALALMLGPPWVGVWWTGLAYDTRRALTIGFLLTALVGHGVALVSAPMAGLVALGRVVRGRGLRQPRPMSARVLLLSVTTLVGLAMLEAGAWGFGVWSRRPPSVPTVPPPTPDRRDAVPEAARREQPDDLLVLVLGESSAEGQPYQPWLSIGHILAWQLEQAVPGRKVRVRMAAQGGVPLAQVYEQMLGQSERPDLVILYSGHNEFQARWGWARVVNYYTDDQALRPRDGLADWVGDWTPFYGMIRDAVQRRQINKRPTPREIRAVVERPVCEPRTRADIRDLFEQELETVALWCEQAGALPIFFIPAGNDVGFDPDRSVLDPTTSLAGRAAFARAFEAARAREAGDAEAAMAAYRVLIGKQPRFAEAHYRLARLLQAKGRTAEARAEYRLARDLDGLPMRCPSEFQDAYRQVAARHDLVLIDAGPRLAALSPTGLLDDHVFHDGQHPTLLGYVELAQAATDLLRERGTFGLARGKAPRIDPVACAEHFGLNAERWAQVCLRAASFWERLAAVRYDSDARRAKAQMYQKAAKAIQAGRAPEDVGVPGLGVRPKGFPRR